MKKAQEDVSNDTSSSLSGDGAKKASEAYDQTNEQLKQAHRGVEDTAQKGVGDAVGSVQEATGTKESTSGVTDNADKTVDSAKNATRDVEDTTQKTVGNVAEKASEGNSAGAAEQAQNAVGSVAGGVKDGTEGVGGGVKDLGAGLGSGVEQGAGAVGSGLGSVTGLGGSSKK